MPTEITISVWILIIVVIIVVIIFINLNKESVEIKKINLSFKTKLNEQELIFRKNEAELKVASQNWAIEELEKFKQSEIAKIKIDIESQALNSARVMLQEWKIENESKIRQDAINRSYSVNLGKITEHLIPFHASFLSQFNPKDARFIGSPIDLIVFDGYSDKRDDIVIYLVEIKTGNSKLTEIQRKIKTVVRNYEIRWAEINPDNSDLTEILNNDLSKRKKNKNQNGERNLFDDNL